MLKSGGGANNNGEQLRQETYTPGRDTGHKRRIEAARNSHGSVNKSGGGYSKQASTDNKNSTNGFM